MNFVSTRIQKLNEDQSEEIPAIIDLRFCSLDIGHGSYNELINLFFRSSYYLFIDHPSRNLIYFHKKCTRSDVSNVQLKILFSQM